MTDLERVVAEILGTGESLEGTVRIISETLAELYQVPPAISPSVMLATPEEIVQMQKEGRWGVVGHGGSYFRMDGVMVIEMPDKLSSVLDKKAYFYASLAAEFAHLYHRIAGGDNSRVMFNFKWVLDTRLRSSGRVKTLLLPKAMVYDDIIPRAKQEASDGFCQQYLLRMLGMREAAKIVEEENSQWPIAVEEGLNTISEVVKDLGSYDKFKQFSSGIINSCVATQTPLTRHPHFIVLHMYVALCDTLANWLAGVYQQKIGGSVEAFRSYVRIPIIPVTKEDGILFERSLQQLNNYLTAHGSLALRVYGR